MPPPSTVPSLADLACAPGPAALPAVPGYEMLRELGRGGMGVVYLARQAGLHRLVALKMILAGGHAGEAARVRFRTEAEAVARLQHPHIVTVHEVGEHQGLPYLCLEYVEGGSLARRFDGTPLPARPAAQLVEALARAADYAHRRGVVHRDLKPANVLLAADGTPKITDFGLAKLLDEAAGPTGTGDVMGTPSYMAPEQTGQQGQPIGAATDVYALGAILYELLTGRPPFKGTTVLDTVFQVVHQEPVPPRRLQPQVPRDLETVCLKCLQKEPAKRYAGAGALADDLGRFLQDEPVRARPVGPWERAVKWARRQPALAGLVAVCAAALGSAIVGALWHNAQLSAALRDVGKQEKETRLQRDRARDRLLAEAEVVNQFLVKVSDSPDMTAHGLEPLRKQLLNLAIGYYQALVREEDSEPRMQAERGRAYSRLAGLLAETGNAAGAETAFREALTIADGLASADPAEARYQALLGEILNNLAGFYFDTNRPEAAEPHCRRAVGVWGALFQSSPGEARYALGVSAGYSRLGQVYRRTNRKTEARAAFKKALEIAEGAAAEHPEDDPLQESLALYHNNLGALLNELRELGKGKDHLLAAVRTWEGLVAKDRTAVSYRTRLALGLQNLGIWHLEGQQLADATRLFERSKEIWTGLRDEHRTVTRYAVELGGASCNLGEVARISGDFPRAAEHYGEAVRTLKDLLAQHGPNERARGYLLRAYAARAETRTHLRRYEEADRDWEEALKLDDHGRLRGKLQVFRALTLAGTGKHAEATAKALALAEKETRYGEVHFVAARVCSVAARVAAGDAGLPADERAKRAARYVSEGLAALRRARELGFFRVPANRFALQVLADLDALRAHDEFKALLAQLETE
jgi:tetratricopeptide (TPR) repeat protein/predicted Ser/Thr protein kinase